MLIFSLEPDLIQVEQSDRNYWNIRGNETGPYTRREGITLPHIHTPSS